MILHSICPWLCVKILRTLEEEVGAVCGFTPAQGDHVDPGDALREDIDVIEVTLRKPVLLIELLFFLGIVLLRSIGHRFSRKHIDKLVRLPRWVHQLRCFSLSAEGLPQHNIWNFKTVFIIRIGCSRSPIIRVLFALPWLLLQCSPILLHLNDRWGSWTI